MKTCPICGAQFAPRTSKVTCGDKRCATAWHKTKPSMCECGTMGVKYTCGGWVCQRCLDIEQMLIQEEKKAVKRRLSQRWHNTREELGWRKFLDMEWTPAERLRERILTMRQSLAVKQGLTS